MIAWGDVYKVVAAMAPLYFALGLGYGSVRWWKLFTPDQCDAVNRLFLYFALPFLGFDFTARAGPIGAGYRVLAADAVAKLVIALTLAGWAAASAVRATRRGGSPSYSWCITGFMLATLNLKLVVGMPLLDAMYGKWARDIIVQLEVLQSVVWTPLVLVVFEARQAWFEMTPAMTGEGAREGGDMVATESGNDDWPATAADGRNTATATGCAFWPPLLRKVGLKVARNPNVYASLLGVAWSAVANRWHLEMPIIVDGSITIMSKTGIALGMFSMGLFIGLQDKFIVCGPGLTVLSMVLRFVAAPAATAVGALVLGLRGDLRRVAILQAALPQSIGSFCFAREYDLHAYVLSTVITVGMLISLPVLIVYYVVLGLGG